AYNDVPTFSKASAMKYSGTGWANVGNAGFSAGTANYIKIATDSIGTPYVVYSDADNYGKATVMKFALCSANTWTGSINTAWENPGNWSCNVLPDVNADIVFNSGAVVTLSSNVTIKSLTLNPGANFTIHSGYRLTVTH